MNVFLIPYTWLRHLSMALWCGAAGLLAWWAVLSWLVLVGATWAPSWDGPILMCAIAGTVAGASVLGEATLRRRSLVGRIWRTALAFALSGAFTLIWYWLWTKIALGVLFQGDLALDASDPSLVSLRYRIGAFVMGGLSCGIGSMLVRKGQAWIHHLVGGVAAGLAAAAAWYELPLLAVWPASPDLYLAGAAWGLVWGFVFGLTAWPIPDDLYAGWVRVLTPVRFGCRIPIDAPDGQPKERFVGHFPRGLDLFLPVSEGVQEMHVSVAVDAQQRYFARGLTIAPTQVRRFLEKIDLRYDPRRPAPLETRLTSGDRIRLGDGATYAELEFLMLPREEA